MVVSNVLLTYQDCEGSLDKGISGCHRRMLFWCCSAVLKSVSDDEEGRRALLKNVVTASIVEG